MINFKSVAVVSGLILGSLSFTSCDDAEKNIIAEYYQRCFGEDLPESMINIQI